MYFHSPEIRYFKSFCSLLYGTLDQSMIGAETMKPTGLGITNRQGRAAGLLLRCCHNYKHKNVIGTDHNNPGVFATAALARYPPSLNNSLAAAHVEQWCEAIRDRGLPFGPECGRGSPAEAPWTDAVGQEWSWPQPSRGFVAGHFENLNSRAIRGSFGKPRD